MPASVSIDTHATGTLQFVGAAMCACLCVKELRAFDAFSAQVLTSTSNLNNTSCHCCFVVGLVPGTIQMF